MAMTHKSTNKILHFSKAIHPTSLKQRLHPKTLKCLSNHISTHKLPYTLQSFKAYKTCSIALMISNYTEFMDETLISYAKHKGIKQIGLEHPIEQLSYFDALSSSLQEQLLLDTLAQNENKEYTDTLKQCYLKGKEDGFLLLQKRFVSNNPK